MRPNELRKKWPKIVDQLEVGDILLFHKRRGPLSGWIQRKTDSYWNHTALVLVPSKNLPFSGPLIVEAINYGIEIHQLKTYSNRPELYDIGIKRFPKMTEKAKNEVVLNFILDNIDVPYDYVRLVGLIIKKVVLEKFGVEKFLLISKYFVRDTSYICSTFVHQAFHNLYDEKHAHSSDTVEGAYEELTQEHLYTPGNVADDDTYKWLFNPVTSKDARKLSTTK